jgi:hypothetical protein
VETAAFTVIDFGSARVGTGIVTVGAAGSAVIRVGRGGCLPTGVLGFSSAARTDTGAFDVLDIATGVAALVGAVWVLATAFGAADFGGAFFEVNFGGAFVGLGGAALDATALVADLAFCPLATAFVTVIDLAVAFGVGFAFCPLATALGTFVDLATAFGAGFAFDLAAFAATLVAARVFVTTFVLTAGTGVFLTTFAVFVTFVALPLSLPLGAVLAFFAVANLISSTVFTSVSISTRDECPNFENG